MEVVPRPDLRAPKMLPRLLLVFGRRDTMAVSLVFLLLLEEFEVACALSSSSRSSSMREQTWRKSWGLSVMTPSMRAGDEDGEEEEEED